MQEGEEHKNHVSKFDPHIWLDMDNAQKMVDNIAAAFIKKDSRNSDYYLKNAHNYKLKLIALDQRYRTELTRCKTKTILHAGHWAFAYLAKKYNLNYIAAYNVSADAEPSPQKMIASDSTSKKQRVAYIYYEDMINPRLAQTIAQETGAGLLKLNNGHDISKADIKRGETFISLMEKNLINLKKRNAMSINVISVDNLTFCYNGLEVISDISFAVKKGDYLGIAGPNGSGKSTLIKNILGILQPQKESLIFLVQPLTSFRQWNRIGYLPQRISALNHHFPSTVEEIVQLGMTQRNTDRLKTHS